MHKTNKDHTEFLVTKAKHILQLIEELNNQSIPQEKVYEDKLYKINGSLGGIGSDCQFITFLCKGESK